MNTEMETLTKTFDRWADYVRAIRESEIRHEDGSFRRVVFQSSYSDEPQVLEGKIERTSRRLGKPFTLEGKRIRGFSVESNGRKIGKITEIEVEVDQESTVSAGEA